MQATIIERTKKLLLITDQHQIEQAINGHLDHDGRRILVIRGQPDSNQTAFQIYYKFSQETDSQGKAFQLSVKGRGLIHSDPTFHQPKRINGTEFLEYLTRWFCPSELINNAANGPAIALLDEFPKFFIAHMCQGRMIAAFSQMFEVVA